MRCRANAEPQRASTWPVDDEEREEEEYELGWRVQEEGLEEDADEEWEELGRGEEGAAGRGGGGRGGGGSRICATAQKWNRVGSSGEA